MSDLVAIVKATRASAQALAAIAKWTRVQNNEDLTFGVRWSAAHKIKLAKARYAKAQAVLAANPLPGDALDDPNYVGSRHHY